MRAKLQFDANLMAMDMARRGWLAVDLARASGLSKMTVSRFLNKERQTARTAKRLAMALGHKVDRYLRSRRSAA